MKKITVIITILCMLMAVSCKSSQSTAEIDRDETLQFIKDEYGLDIDEYVISAEGLTLDYGKAFEISLNEDGYQAVKSQLEQLCGKAIDTYTAPGYEHKICEALNEKTTEFAFMYLVRGEAKTATTEFYLASDDGGKYLYVFC